MYISNDIFSIYLTMFAKLEPHFYASNLNKVLIIFIIITPPPPAARLYYVLGT